MELWDVYDKDRCRLGTTHIRGERLQCGQYHLVVHCAVFNSEGAMLIQQRQSTKGWADMWDISAGGSALMGETSQQAITRELFEEISVQYDFSNIRPALTVNFSVGFDDVYVLKSDVDIDKLQLQLSEVQAVRWATCDEVLQLLEHSQFMPYSKPYISLLFDIASRRDGGDLI